MATLSGIITPTNVETASSTSTLTNKTIDGDNNTVTNIPLSTGVTGTLPVANGGTGADTLTGVLKGNGTSAVTAGDVDLTSEVTGALPTANGGTGLAALGTAGQVLAVNSGATALEFAGLPAGGFSNMTVFTSSGTFTVPAGVTKCKVTVVGGGGGGILDAFTGGGGGGGTAIKICDLTGVSTVTVTIGAGGARGNNLTDAGGTSSFGSFCSATGGTCPQSNNQGGRGGNGVDGDINITGQGGMQNSRVGGGSSFLGGGVPASEASTGITPNFGGGGNSSNTNFNGGLGRAGVVVVEF